jgi:hypothetical protein
MKLLIDTSPAKLSELIKDDLVIGQLITPLTSYSDAGLPYGIDNGSFTSFDKKAFTRILDRQDSAENRCLFVAVPDIVGNARRTLEIWAQRFKLVPPKWPMALVAQDGMENLEIPWNEMQAIFIGGTTQWKDSRCVVDIVKTAKTLGLHVHVGRVNTAPRYKHFAALGADTCDGSGIARFSHMLQELKECLKVPSNPELFDNLMNADA